MSETKSLVRRLTRQLASKGNDDAKSMAIGLLTKQGLMKDGHLTDAGAARQAMGAAGRAKDRAARASGRPADDFKYSAKTNRATLKKGAAR